MRQVLRKCSSGTLSANMAVMQLCFHAPTEEAAREILKDAIEQESGIGRDRLLELQSLWRDTPNVFDIIRAIGAELNPAFDDSKPVGSREGVARCAVGFDAVAKISPVASVALYSLGREDLLEKATAEVVDNLRSERLLGPDRSALEIGCGIGRFLAALAPELSRVVGLDVSSNMLMQARQRCSRYANVECLEGDGQLLHDVPSTSFDLVLAIDSFPCLVAAGQDVVKSNIEEAHRVLRSEGRLIIINYSYRDDDEIDRSDLLRLSAEFGFSLQRCGIRPFKFWDGAVYDLKRLE